MIECYFLPTANKKTGVYFEYEGDNFQKRDGGVLLNNLVLIEKNGQLENERVGIKYTIQISKQIKNNRPALNDIIHIEDFDYRISTVVECINPVFAPFWECEVKKVISNYHYITVGLNDVTARYNTANYTNDWEAVKAAVDYAGTLPQKNFKKVFVKNTNGGVYQVVRGGTTGRRIQMIDNCTVEFGDGVKVVGTKPNDYLFYNLSNNGSNVVVNFVVKGGEFDLNNALNGSAFGFLDTEKSGLIDVTVKRGAVGGWFVKFGSENSGTSTFYGKNNFTKNCVWDTHQGSLGMHLIYNQEDFLDQNSVFLNKGTVVRGPIFEIWQNCENTKIINPKYIDCNGFNYYSNSCNNTYFENVYAENTGLVIQGANISDNVIFGPEGGIQRAHGLVINGFTAIGGVNSSNAEAIQLGAVAEYNIKFDKITGYKAGISFHKGNNDNNATAINGFITMGEISNGNPLSSNADLSPAILFTKTGDYNLIIEGGSVYDDQTVKTQLQPVFFEIDAENLPYTNITVRNTSLAAYGGRQSIKKHPSVVLDPATVKFVNISNSTKGTLAAYYYD
jgi:hypothetical protein